MFLFSILFWPIGFSEVMVVAAFHDAVVTIFVLLIGQKVRNSKSG